MKEPVYGENKAINRCAQLYLEERKALRLLFFQDKTAAS